MQNEVIQTKALIVRTVNSGDNDRILTAISPELGKISVSAKGVKSLKNKNNTATGVLCYSELVLKRGRELHSLSSAECIEGFYHLRDSVEGLAYAAYFAALLESSSEPGIPAAEELRLILNTLHVLQGRPQDGALLKLVFELRLSELMGLAPYISEECQCGAEAEYFDIAEGETTCALHKGPGAVRLGHDQLAVMEYILTSDLKSALFFATQPAIVSALAPVSEKYLEYHLGHLPKQLAYLKSMVK